MELYAHDRQHGVLFWALAIFGVIALVRYLARGDRPAATRPTPEQVLAEWLARGEIDEQEYQQRPEALCDGSRSPAGF